MKFCPECGTEANGKTKCDVCGYDSVTGEMPKKEEPVNVPVGVAAGPMDSATQYQQHVLSVKDGIRKAHLEMKEIPLEELKKDKIDTGDLLRIHYSNQSGIFYKGFILDFKKQELEETINDLYRGTSTVYKYKVDDADLKKMKDLVLDNNLAAWEKISFNGIIPIFDMPKTELQLFFQKKNVNLLSNLFFDDVENDIYSSIILSFDHFKNQDKFISKEEKELEKGFQGIVNPKTSDDTAYCPKCGTPMKNDICPKCSHYAE